VYSGVIDQPLKDMDTDSTTNPKVIGDFKQSKEALVELQ